LADKDFQEWAKDKYVLVKLNSKETPEYRDQFNVAGLPTVILTKPGGEEIDRTLGFVRTDEFISTIEDYHKGIGTLTAMLAEEKQNANAADAEFQFKLGKKLYAHSRFGDADARYARAIKADSSNAKDIAAEAQIRRAWIASKEENWGLAIAFAKALRQRWPESDLASTAVVYAGYYSDKGGMTKQAIQHYEEYLKEWPDGEDAEWVTKQLAELKAPPEENESN
jgi:tetratricopeptide (TPR) repeat protein